MNNTQCSFCKGKLEFSTTEFATSLNDQLVIISDIPAWVCENCDESYFDLEASERLDKALDKIKSNDVELHPIKAGKIKLSEIAS